DDLLAGSLSDKARDKLEKAKDKLNDALEELDEGDIKKVLKDVSYAVKELLKAEEEGADVDMIINCLIVLAETQAHRAVDAAIAAGGDPKKIEKAQKEIEKAEEELAEGDDDKAIYYYGKAWYQAQKA
ncbi:MAG: hypothetical protein KJN72_02515, partial [Woeseia sp.]|nr:hypothetical protein [Woeseia sp.]